MKQQQAELALLNPFVGKWATSGKIYATTNQEEMLVHGYDIYEWLPGHTQLLHKVNVYLGPERVQNSELIAFDKLTSGFKIQYTDSQGKESTLIAMVNGKEWTFIGKNLRFKGNFNANDTEINGFWEQSLNGKDWRKYMEIRLIKDQ